MSETDVREFNKNKKHRTVVRANFSRLVNHLKDEITQETVHLDELKGRFQTVSMIYEELKNLDTKISDHLFQFEENEAILEEEVSKAYSYLETYNQVNVLVQSKLNESRDYDLVSSNSAKSESSNLKTKLKLPKIELVQFSGNLKEWLPFWGIFKRIDEDPSIDDVDKFHYLVQATIPNSKARQIVDSYPATSENYRDAIQSLKSRFGRDDLLIEVYVRELLKLLLNNLSQKVVISTLFDKLECQIRALDTLGVTTDKCAAILYPLVESCLPEDLLRAWQRHSDFDPEADMKNRLDALLKFLRIEVTNEERISLATSGFGDSKRQLGKSSKPFLSNKTESIPTATGLVNKKVDKTPLKCVFCGAKHLTENCKSHSNLTHLEKVNLLSSNKCCYLCTKYGHVSKKCHVRLNCSLCNGRHATVMCNKSQDRSDVNNVNDNNLVPCESNLANNAHTEVFLQTVRVNIRGGNKERAARVIFDSGSQRSYILKKTAEEMGYVSFGKETLSHALFGGSATNAVEHNRHKVRLSDLGNNYYCNFEVLDQDVICNNISTIKAGPWINELQSFGINVYDTVDGPVEVLIGSDIGGKLFTGKRCVLTNNLVAMETLLGWVLMGKVNLKGANSKTNSMTVTSLLTPNMSISDMWSLDVLGIKDPICVKSESDTKSAVMDQFLDTVSVNSEGRYEVKLPWVEDHPPLPTNLDMAKRRLDSLLVKLNKSDNYDRYQNVLTDWENLGIIEKVPGANLEVGHYLPHRHVLKESSATTKLRPVFDASAKEKSQPSLNDCLWKGDNLIECIPSILNRFRLKKLGVVSDIEKAFLQISLNSSERDFLRFLWVNQHGEPIVYRHARVVFGVNCSPFLLGAVIKLHLEKTLCLAESGLSDYSIDIILQIMKSFYVDNCMASFDNVSDLEIFIHQSTNIMRDAKFCLRGWEYTDINISEGENVVTPVLGLNWDRKADTLEINTDNLTFDNLSRVTKRVILSFAHKLFDPIGFTCPVALIPKILLQKTWKDNICWDEEVSEEIKDDFIKWAKSLDCLKHLKIPRHLSPQIQGNVSWSIHCFCDASQNAYATAVYLRGEMNGHVSVQLVQAKSRVSPVKKMSIPRLELMGATIGVRLTKAVIESIDLKNVEIFYWTDSTTVLSWIRRENNWAVFVWNRVKEIRELSPIESWKYVPGPMNPADLPSRGCSPKQLTESQWWEGPTWLIKSCDNWPQQTYACDEEAVGKELKKSTSSCITMLNSERFVDWYLYFSRYDKLLRMVGWIIRFTNNSRSQEDRIIGPLVKDEIVNAEKTVFKLIQRETFSGLKDDRLKSFCVFEDLDGLIKLKTKLVERPDTQNFRYPVVLPSDHPVVQRLIRYKHEENCHIGVQGLLSMLREDVWIICGRKTVKSVVEKCITCKRYSSKRLDSVPVQLPLLRVRDATVFEICGIDFAGPVFLKGGQKAWIVLYTCAVYRAVHLELVTSLSTDTFLQSLRRFISRRGRPSVICTDNGTNFQGAANSLNKLNWDSILKYSSIKQIEWKFNPPASPWWGGWWERLIRLLKQLLRKVLGRSCLNYEQLITVLCDCESVINARPLTYVSEDSGDMEVLTPAMFLLEAKEHGVVDIDCVERTDLCHRLKHQLKLKEDLRKRFRNEYLSQLILHSNKSKNRQVKVGEIVLIGSDNGKRMDWPMARVQKTFKGKDGNVRLVELKTSKGTLLRPIQHIYPIEVVVVNNQEEEVQDKESLNEKVLNQHKFTKRGRQIKLPKRLEV